MIKLFDQLALGRRIQDKRKMKGMTQEQLGSRLGISAQAVSKWETGESAPDIGLVPSLCSVLDSSADTLLGITSEYLTVPCKKTVATDVNAFRFEAVEACQSSDSVFIKVKFATTWDNGNVILFNPPDCSVFCIDQRNVIKPGRNTVTFEVSKDLLIEDTVTMKFFPGDGDPPGCPCAWISFRVSLLIK